MKKNIDAMNHPTKVKETIGERIYTIVVYLLLILISWNVFYHTDLGRLRESFAIFCTSSAARSVIPCSC